MELTSFTTENYEKSLNKWSQQTVKSNVLFGAQGLTYCSAKPAHDKLTGEPNNWIIIDAGSNCPPHSLELIGEDFYENTTYVGKVSATDPENGEIHYSLVAGAGDDDNAKLTLNLTSGALAFIEAPDYEAKGSAAETNDYSIRVRATDTTGLFVEENFIITVLDADDVPPVITIHPGIKKAEGDITDTKFTVSDRFSILNVEVDKSSVAAAENIVCQPSAHTDDTGFPYTNNSEDPEHNHLEISCTITIKSSGKLVLRAIDEAGYSSTATEEGYVIDTLGPTFTVANIDTTSPNSLHNPMVKFKAVSPVGIEKYEVIYTEDNGGPGVSPSQKTVQVDYDGEVQELPIALDPHEASHTVEVIAYSKAGKTTTRRITFPAEVTINAPTIISNEAIDDTTVKIVPPSGGKVDEITIGGSAYTEGVTILGDCVNGSNETVYAPYTTTVTCPISGIKKTGMIEVSAKDDDNNLIGSNQQKYFYDTEVPNITISAPTRAKKDNIDDIAITVTDNIEMYSDDAWVDEDNSSATVTGWSCAPCSIDRRKLNCTVTVTGSGDLVIKSADKARNESSSLPITFTVDRLAPVVGFNTPLSYVNSNNQSDYTLSGSCTASDNDLLVTIGGQPHVAACRDNNTWALTTDLSSYSDGEIAISAKQTDAVGNEGVAEGSLTKDTDTPTASFNDKVSNTALPELTGSVSDPTAAIEIVIDGNPYIAANRGNGTWDLPAEEIIPLADDVYTVDLTVSDKAGNANTYSYANALTIDTVGPTVTINQADTQTDPTNVNRAEFVVKFSEDIDQGTLSACDFTIGGSAGTASLEQVTNREYKLIITNMVSGDTVQVSLPADTVQDLAGNFNTASDSDDNSVTFDDTAPAGTINAIRPTTIARPGFSGTVDDGDATVTVKVNGTDYLAANSGGVWTLSADTIHELAVGNYTVQVVFTDTIGNYSTKTTDLTILSKEANLNGQTDNQGTADVVNKATIKSLSGTCKAGVLNANSLAGGLTAPEANVAIIGGISYKLSCEELGGDATVGIILGQYYSDLTSLRIYKQQDGKLVDITSQVNLRNENSQTKLTLTLIDGADYDEDGVENYEILDPLYIGIHRQPPLAPGTGVGRGFSPAALVVTAVGTILWLIGKRCNKVQSL